LESKQILLLTKIYSLNEEAYLQNITTPRKRRGDTATKVYKSRQEFITVFYAFVGFLKKTTGCLSVRVFI
jgi:hypothetical protein